MFCAPLHAPVCFLVRAGNSEMNRSDTKRTGLGWTGDKHLHVQPDVGLTVRIQEVDGRSGGHVDTYGGGAHEELTPPRRRAPLQN